MNELEIIDVPFYDETIPSAIDDNKIIWSVVANICKNLGMTEDQMKRQRKNIQKDIVLSNGCKKLRVKFDPCPKEVLCIQNDYIPLWLAKVSITPTMQKENPELVDKLVRYQLKVKDVLADYFMKINTNYSSTDDKFEYFFEMQSRFHKDEMNLLSKFIESQNNFFQNFTTSMSNLAKYMVASMQPSSREDYIPDESEIEIVEFSQDVKDYKRLVCDICEEIVKISKFKSVNAVLSHVYKLVRNQYGIVWEQEMKEYMEEHDLERKPSMLTLIANSDESKYYKSIVRCKLQDMLSEYRKIKDKEDQKFREENFAPFPTDEPKHDDMDDAVLEDILNDTIDGNMTDDDEISDCKIVKIMIPYAESWDDVENIISMIAKHINDNAKTCPVTYRYLYKAMEMDKPINWAYYRSAYKRKHYISNKKMKPSKKLIICDSKKLRKLFIKVLNERVEELNNAE